MTQEEFLAIFDQYRPMVYALALSYGAYYVPAVEEACLTGLPVWDGGFN